MFLVVLLFFKFVYGLFSFLVIIGKFCKFVFFIVERSFFDLFLGNDVFCLILSFLGMGDVVVLELFFFFVFDGLNNNEEIRLFFLNFCDMFCKVELL